MLVKSEATHLPLQESRLSESFIYIQETQERHSRADERKRVLTKILATFAILDSLYVGLYKAPVEAEQERLSHTHVSINEAFAPTNNAPLDSTTLVLGGFGTRDSYPIAEALSPLQKIGEVDSIVEDDNGVSAENIANNIIHRAISQGTTSIGLWGDSLGGPILTDVARIIQQSHTPLHVSFITLDCSPTSFDSLREDKQRTIKTLDFWSNVLPDLPYHPAVSYFYTSSQMGESPFSAASGVHGKAIIDKMNDNETPSPALLESQVAFVINPNLRDNLTAISKVASKPAPVIISIRPTSSHGDAVINSPVATKELASIMHGISLEYHALMINGISHGDPTANRQAYDKVLDRVIVPLLLARGNPLKPVGNTKQPFVAGSNHPDAIIPYEALR